LPAMLPAVQSRLRRPRAPAFSIGAAARVAHGQILAYSLLHGRKEKKAGSLLIWIVSQ
jgi:hypothetical protein